MTRPGQLLGALAVAGAISLVIVPVPTPVIDLLLCANLGLAVLLVLVALSVVEARALSSLPGLLLLTTLFRLALNVSTTRLILVQADAGGVVKAFGEFVVAGSYVVGGVVFAIITIVQYVVIATGAARVAEVKARFSLDALPGDQLAIDADVRAGSIGPHEAGRRRRELETESRFYGSLDGAMRLVKGDAIAGLVITGVNLVGGLGVGVLRDGATAPEAARTYGLLTIGDGLAAQIPALLVSVAAGLIVTRVAEPDQPRSLPRAAIAQLLDTPANLAGAGLLLVVLGLVPGLPLGPFLVLGLAAVLVAWRLSRRPVDLAAQGPPARLSIDVGPDLATSLGGSGALSQLATSAAATAASRSHLAGPPVSVAVTGEAGPDAWALSLDRVPLASGTLDPSRPHDARAELRTVLLDAMGRILPSLVGVQEVHDRVDEVASRRPALVREIVPARIALGDLTRLVRLLLRDGLPAGDLRAVLEALAAAPRRLDSSDVECMAEVVRPAFQRWLMARVERLRGEDALPVYVLDELLTLACEQVPGDAEGEPLLDAELARDLREAAEAVLPPADELAVVVSSAQTRRPVQRALATARPRALVVSPGDLDPNLPLEPVGTLRAP